MGKPGSFIWSMLEKLGDLGSDGTVDCFPRKTFACGSLFIFYMNVCVSVSGPKEVRKGWTL